MERVLGGGGKTRRDLMGGLIIKVVGEVDAHITFYESDY